MSQSLGLGFKQPHALNFSSLMEMEMKNGDFFPQYVELFAATFAVYFVKFRII